MAYLLDADWAIEALAGRGHAPFTLRRLLRQGVSISQITVAEIYKVAFNSPNPQAHLVTFRHFLSSFRILTINDPIAERFAEIRAHLRRRGTIIPDFDIITGATALYYDLTVLTFNARHLERIPDVKLYRVSPR
jgi:tRNA(fMet)-specific endonuclease VapC